MKIKIFTLALIITILMSTLGTVSYADTFTATKFAYHQNFYLNNYNKFLNQHKKAQVEKLIYNYEKNFVNAINSGDFAFISSYLLPGSKICKTQRTAVKTYYERGIKERLISHKIKSMSEFDNGDFRVVVNEKLYIQKGNQPLEYREFENIYRVTRTNTDYKMSQILSVKILESKTIKN